MATTSAARTPPSVEGGRVAPPPARPRLHRLAQRLESLDRIDVVAKPLGRAVRRLLRPGPVRDALSGRALGHALHPLLTDVPIGTWTSATILDLMDERRFGPASERLIAIGIAASVPTAASGMLEWADTEPADDEVRRAGAVHAMVNMLSLSLFAASLVARRRGAAGGRVLGLAGAGALGVGGHLGGHLSYAKGVGVDATALGRSLEEWTDVAATGDLTEGAALFREVNGVGLLIVRDRGRVRVLGDRCSHRGGPLHEGAIEDGCVTCPVHGSRFRLEDGSVERGPSPYPQPTFDVRERDGGVEVRSAHERPTL